jgi:hypothetical protein
LGSIQLKHQYNFHSSKKIFYSSSQNIIEELFLKFRRKKNNSLHWVGAEIDVHILIKHLFKFYRVYHIKPFAAIFPLLFPCLPLAFLSVSGSCTLATVLASLEGFFCSSFSQSPFSCHVFHSPLHFECSLGYFLNVFH